MSFLHDLPDLLFHLLELLPEGRGRDPQRAVAEDDQLLRIVGGGHPHPVVLSDLIRRLRDIGVRSFRLLGIDDMEEK